jgi:uncharacterized protein (DUF2336 family)
VATDVKKLDVQSLLVLAADRSSGARKTLMDTIVDYFLPEETRLTEHERALMGDIMGKLVTTVEADVRRHLSTKLAAQQTDLPDLVAFLANDEIDIARPLLEKSSILRDPTLIEIVKARTDEHRLAIAIRDSVSSELADALIAHGSTDVVEALIRNDDAQLSRRAMEYLVAESRRIDRFREPLLNRSDLPADLAHRMYWWVSAALRHRILKTFKIDDAVLDAAIADSARQAIADVDEGNGVQARAQKLARRLMETRELTDLFLLNTLRQQRMTLFIAGLAERGGLMYKTASRVVMDRGFESFIVLARGIGVGRDTVTSIVLLLADVQNPEAARRPEILTAILKLFDAIPEDKAKRILTLWQRDLNYQEAIDDLRSTSAA